MTALKIEFCFNCGFRFVRPTMFSDVLEAAGIFLKVHNCSLCRVQLVEVHHPHGVSCHVRPMDVDPLKPHYTIEGKIKL